MKLMISACLMGTRCRYDGGAYDSMVLQNRLEKCTLIPVCPEQLGGLPTPRSPAERVGERVRNREGADVTAAFFPEPARRWILRGGRGAAVPCSRSAALPAGAASSMMEASPGSASREKELPPRCCAAAELPSFPRISWRNFLHGSLRRGHNRRPSRWTEWPVRAVTGQRPKPHESYFTCIACSWPVNRKLLS